MLVQDFIDENKELYDEMRKEYFEAQEHRKYVDLAKARSKAFVVRRGVRWFSRPAAS